MSGKTVADGFVYSSGTNTEWMNVEDIRRRLLEVATEEN
jgi:hypothetical protein